jgi:hypothetical protein
MSEPSRPSARFDREAVLSAAGPEIAALQAEVRDAVRGLKRVMAAGVAFPILFIASIFVAAPGLLLFPAFVAFGGALVFFSMRYASRIYRARSKVIAAIAPALGLSFAARPAAPIDLTAFAGSYYGELFKLVRCEDVIAGERGGIAFQIFDAKLTARSKGPDGKWRPGHPPKWLEGVAFQVTRIVRVEAPGRWTSRTVIAPDAGLANRLQQPKGMERVRLVDPRFEKLFEVYSTDQTEARALLTPVLMERLTALDELFAVPKSRSSEDSPPPKITVFADGVLLTALPLTGGRSWSETGSKLKLAQVDALVVDRILWEIDAALGVVDAVAGPPALAS